MISHISVLARRCVKTMRNFPLHGANSGESSSAGLSPPPHFTFIHIFTFSQTFLLHLSHFLNFALSLAFLFFLFLLNPIWFSFPSIYFTPLTLKGYSHEFLYLFIYIKKHFKCREWVSFYYPDVSDSAEDEPSPIICMFLIVRRMSQLPWSAYFF